MAHPKMERPRRDDRPIVVSSDHVYREGDADEGRTAIRADGTILNDGVMLPNAGEAARVERVDRALHSD